MSPLTLAQHSAVTSKHPNAIRPEDQPLFLPAALTGHPGHGAQFHFRPTARICFSVRDASFTPGMSGADSGSLHIRQTRSARTMKSIA